MSEFLTLNHELINNLRSLIEDNNDFNWVEQGLSSATGLVDWMWTESESTRQSTVDHNDFLEAYINLITSGGLKITEENAKLIYLDIADWLNEKIGTGIFNDNPFLVYVNFTESQKVKLFENSGEAVLKIFMDRGHIWKIRDASSGDKEIYPKKLIFKDQTDNFQTPFVDYVAKMVKDGTLDGFTSKIISEITREDYSFNKFQRDVGKIINDFIVLSADESAYQPVKLIFTEEFSNYYMKLELGDDGSYSLPQSIYSGTPSRVPKSALSEVEVNSFGFPNVLQYPTTILRNADGEVIEAIKNDLQNFKDLEGTSIIDYNFRFLQDPRLTKGRFVDDLTNTVDTGFIKKWISRSIYDSVTTTQHITNLITGGYIDFLVHMVEDFESGRLNTTIGNHYKKALNGQSTLVVLNYVFFEKIIAAKKTFFDNIAQATKPESEGGEKVTEDERERAYTQSAEAFKRGQGEDLPDLPSEEDIENRQKYFKQCALMLNLSKLRDNYQEKLNEQYSNKLPYGGRFTTLYCKDKEQELLLTRMVSSKNEQKLFELETHKISKLVPKIRLFKVFNSTDGGEKEVEFIFDRTSKQRDSFMSATFDKGNGVGLKNFSFEFNGTSPATARNDITASLTLFFQSFEDFTRTRTGYSDKYRYVDLVIQPTPDKQGEVGGIEILSDRQYEPQFYRIRADVGYVLPTEADGFTSDEITAIRVSNKSFFLNMVDHDISFGKDGTVEIKISYRAYLESLLKHPRLDALASPELIARRIANAREFTKQIRDKKCSVEQLKELQVSLAAQEAVLVKQSLSSIVTRLRDRGVIYTTLIKKKHKEFFLKKGFFRKCDFETDAVSDGSNGADVKLVLNSDLPESSDDFDFIDSGNRAVQFFYFGDLLYTVLDCVYDSNNEVRKGTGYNRNSIVLGSFEFEAFQKSSKEGNVYNIADIPISVDFFSRWFVDNVVSQKSTRKTFPLMNFIRSLSNYLIRPAIVENCVNRKIETKLRFQTSQVTAFEPDGVNPLHKHYKLGDGGRTPVALDVASLRKGSEPTLPLKGGPVSDANSNFKDFHTFVILTALGSSLSYAGSGKYSDDIVQGRFHVHVGQNAGLVKTLSLSKSDQQYIREARFFQNGIDGLLQLSAVYVANIEMFGNVLFYPGMEFFFNPYGIGGPEFDPTKKASDANKLGIGGYHTITSVKSSISPGKFTTTIAGQQYYSGDGTGNPNTVKQKNADAGAVGSIEEYKPVDETEGNDGFKECNQVILDAQNYAFEEGTAAGRITGGGSTNGTAPVETAATDENEDASSEPTVEETLDQEFGGESDSTNATATNEELGESSAVVITDESQNATPEVKETYGGVLKTVKSSQTSTSASGGQLNQTFTEEGGKVTEMTDGTLYFQTIDGRGVFGPKQKITDHSRIRRQ